MKIKAVPVAWNMTGGEILDDFSVGEEVVTGSIV